jgi:hypothetical protein
MGENEFYKIDKLVPYKTKARGRAYVKDSDLQIHMPNVKEPTHLDNANAFNKLLSYYNEVGKTQSTGAPNWVNEREAIRSALMDAESIFNSMVEMSKQLQASANELMEMQS